MVFISQVGGIIAPNTKQQSQTHSPELGVVSTKVKKQTRDSVL